MRLGTKTKRQLGQRVRLGAKTKRQLKQKAKLHTKSVLIETKK